ncbi:MAG: hypothetical protein IE926_09340, partial [Micrococcales bacterium]|nr:hypothetical protein [Micrococcales bacterium]
MTWSVLAAVGAVGVLLAAAWWLGRQQPAAARGGDPEATTYRLAFRGYRMDQVDDVVGTLEARIAVRDDEIRRLRGEAPMPGAPATPDAG